MIRLRSSSRWSKMWPSPSAPAIGISVGRRGHVAGCRVSRVGAGAGLHAAGKLVAKRHESALRVFAGLAHVAVDVSDRRAHFALEVGGRGARGVEVLLQF